MTIGIDAHNLELMSGGAAFRYLINLLRYWRDSGHKFILYFKDKIPELLELEAQNFEKKLLKSLPGINSNAFFTHFSLFKAAKADKIDVLFCPYYVAPVFYKGKLVLTLHDIFYEAHPESFSWPSIWDKILLRKVSFWSAKKAGSVIAPSEFSKNEIIKHYKINKEKIFVTTLGVEEKFKVLEDKEGIERVKRKYDVKNKFILYVGAIFNRRRIPELIKAFIKLSEKLSEYDLVIVGSNQTNPFIDIEKIIKSNKRIKRIEYLSDEDLVPLLNGASLTVYLSDYEGFGLPILESMACAVPVVTANKGSLPEVGGDAALYVNNPANTDEISGVIYRGLTDDKLREELIERGLERAQMFSWERCAEETLRIITN